jgi:hypothetical protein
VYLRFVAVSSAVRRPSFRMRCGPDVQRARLLELAARRGEKGFSRLVQEAVDRLLAGADSREVRAKAALALEGSLSTSISCVATHPGLGE